MVGVKALHARYSIDTASSLNNLAAVLLNKRDDAAAQPVLARLLKTLEKLKGNDDPETVEVRSLLAELASWRQS